MLAAHLYRLARSSPVRYAVDPSTQEALHQWLRAVFSHLRMGGTHEPFEASVNQMHGEDIDPRRGGVHALVHEMHRAIHQGDTEAIAPYADALQEHGLFRPRHMVDDPGRIVGDLARFYGRLRDQTPAQQHLLALMSPGHPMGRRLMDDTAYGLDPRRGMGAVIRTLIARLPGAHRGAGYDLHDRASQGGMGDVADLYEFFRTPHMREHVANTPGPVRVLPPIEGDPGFRDYHMDSPTETPEWHLRNTLNNLLGDLNTRGDVRRFLGGA